MSLSLGLVCAGAQTEMAKAALVTSMKEGDTVVLFNAPTLVVATHLEALTPVNMRQRIAFTPKALNAAGDNAPFASAAFWDGNKLDGRRFWKSNGSAVFLENGVCFVNVESTTSDFQSSEIMNSAGSNYKRNEIC